MFKKIFFVTALLLASLLSAKPVVIASIAPVGYLAKAVGGDKIEVQSLAKGDVHSYEPKPNDMKAVAKARIFIAAGLEFEEAWIPRFKASAKNLVVVQSDAKIAKLKEEHAEHDEEYGQHAAKDDKHSGHSEHEAKDKHEEHDEEHEAHADPHVWLNPMLAITMARNISDALIAMDKANKDFYLKNFQKLMNDLLAFDESAKNELAGLKNRKFVVYHPAWGYFAEHYDLEQISIERNGKEPKIDKMASTVKMIKDENIKVIFADPNRSQKSAQVLASQTGAKVELLDPLGYNLLENLKIAVRAIKDANSPK
ncbi:MAG: zinc ABC transporter substrate-binding protein [Campylobacter sp.]|uniref:metal ABC transporter solute-binding protein, Zn/Mn family n=1 Tax=Campylobacter sp. TaxID=205 RepID=UPI002AA92829|nr:zinc ABC transporter substrate-binding protein [Campylobacter sp.]MCI6343563.1 zinc ABC transporter substrate-binding protein [Campylobacter sp.]MCI6695395.1 zinc ABC transporter substrate-binding protein [Campylobacter sp.]MCI7463246.1 zinc ABC transporter substrate-binding protein [Campylobacter sp.]